MVGIPMTPELGAAIRAFTPVVKRALKAYDAGSFYLNFVEEPSDVAAMFDGDTYTRLRQVKRCYDPRDVFRSNHPIPAAR
jgi:hypothetical protein